MVKNRREYWPSGCSLVFVKFNLTDVYCHSWAKHIELIMRKIIRRNWKHLFSFRVIPASKTVRTLPNIFCWTKINTRKYLFSVCKCFIWHNRIAFTCSLLTKKCKGYFLLYSVSPVLLQNFMRWIWSLTHSAYVMVHRLVSIPEPSWS